MHRSQVSVLALFLSGVVNNVCLALQPSCPEGCVEVYNPVCGSDGVTYDNECFFTKAQCNGHADLVLVSKGPCQDPSGSPCDALTCSPEFKPVCGSDDQTYNNLCELQRAGCTNPTLTFGYNGVCQDEASSDSEPPAIPSECDWYCYEMFHPLCGSDGVTYDNDCYFFRAACLDRSLRIHSDGWCATGSTSKDASGSSSDNAPSDDASGGSAGSSNNGSTELESTLRCLKKLLNCSSEDRPVCGSDGTTYANECTLMYAQCLDATIVGIASGACGTAPVRDEAEGPACEACIDTSDNAVCGSNGETFRNYCALEQARCDDPGLRVHHAGACSSSTAHDVPATFGGGWMLKCLSISCFLLGFLDVE